MHVTKSSIQTDRKQNHGYLRGSAFLLLCIRVWQLQIKLLEALPTAPERPQVQHGVDHSPQRQYEELDTQMLRVRGVQHVAEEGENVRQRLGNEHIDCHNRAAPCKSRADFVLLRFALLK